MRSGSVLAVRRWLPVYPDEQTFSESAGTLKGATRRHSDGLTRFAFPLEAGITVATARVLQESKQTFRLAEIHLNAGRSEICRAMSAKCQSGTPGAIDLGRLPSDSMDMEMRYPIWKDPSWLP